MIHKAYEYWCKELFELQNFPFNYQDLSVELYITEGEGFDFEIQDMRLRKVALEDPEWTILQPNITWRNPAESEFNLRIRRMPAYYLQNIVFICRIKYFSIG